jgi:hypothetical protein
LPPPTWRVYLHTTITSLSLLTTELSNQTLQPVRDVGSSTTLIMYGPPIRIVGSHTMRILLSLLYIVFVNLAMHLAILQVIPSRRGLLVLPRNCGKYEQQFAWKTFKQSVQVCRVCQLPTLRPDQHPNLLHMQDFTGEAMATLQWSSGCCRVRLVQWAETKVVASSP